MKEFEGRRRMVQPSLQHVAPCEKLKMLLFFSFVQITFKVHFCTNCCHAYHFCYSSRIHFYYLVLYYYCSWESFCNKSTPNQVQVNLWSGRQTRIPECV